MQKKRPNKCPTPSSDSNDSSSCGEEAVEGQAWEKEGAKSLHLQREESKKMEKENDLVGSSQGSDSKLSEAGNK